jgi:hypothetical protein
MMPAPAYTAMAKAVAAYEPEATALVIASPSALLQVLLEAARRGGTAVAPLIREDERQRAVRAVRATERERLFVAIRHKIPLSQPWRGEALDLIYEVWRETDG